MTQINGHTRVRLANGVSVFQRGPNMLQFGLDATRTGIIETPCVEALRPLLDDCARPRQLRHVRQQLLGHLDEEAARSLLDDLLSYRILVADSPTQVLMIGTSELAMKLADLLSDSGVLVRAPLRRQREYTFLTSTDQWAPLVIVDQFPRAAALGQVIKQRPGRVLPVALVDSRVLIGPLRVRVTNPCINCAQLHHSDRDAGWMTAVHQLPSGPVRPDPVVVAAGAAAAATVVRRLAGVPDPPGVSAPHLAPGHVRAVDPFGPRMLTDSELAVHPRCDVCFS